MSSFRLHDWNDARLIVACADLGSFARAAEALGLDQTTVSRRIGALEAALGRPLFTRRRSGASPTVIGLALVEQARRMAAAAEEIEATMRDLALRAAPRVTVGASEGLLTYTLIPALLGDPRAELPLDRRLVAGPLPDLAFTTALSRADVSVVATSPGDVPRLKGAVRVRKVGVMHFRPVAAAGFLAARSMPDHFDRLAGLPLLDIGVYRAIRGLDAWNGLVAAHASGEVLVVPNTPRLARPILAGRGIGLLPDYASLTEPALCTLDLVCPDLKVILWLVAHEDALREPAVRTIYDLLATLFLRSRWYRER